MKINLQNYVRDYVSKNFYWLFKIFQNSDKPFIVLEGSRGSAKTYQIILLLLLQTWMIKGYKILIGQKYDSDIRNASYAEVVNIINELGLQKYFLIKKTPKEIINKITGVPIMFIGLDKAVTKKGLDSKIKIAWFEEADLISYEDFRVMSFTLRNARKILSYNTVDAGSFTKMKFHDNCYDGYVFKRGNSWLKEGKLFYLHHSTYLENEYCPQILIDEMEELKNENPELYKVDGLGLYPSRKGAVIENFEVKEFDESIFQKEDILCGVDYGWMHPLALERMVWIDKPTPEIYVLPGEIYQSQLTPERLREKINHIRDNDMVRNTILCDSSSPQTINIINNILPAKGVNKSKVKREEKIKILKNCKWIIHPSCTGLIKNLNTMKHKKHQSEYTDEVEKINDDAFDAVMYGLDRELVRLSKKSKKSKKAHAS